MRVRNRTGKVQVTAGKGLRLPPMEWVDGVPSDVALELYRERKVELDWQANAADLPFNEADGFHVYWLSPFSLADGYATAAEQTVLALSDHGFKLVTRSCWFESPNGLNPRTLAMMHEPMPDRLPRVGLCMALPAEFIKLSTAYRIGLTMYESSNPLVLHPEWKHECKNVDMILVPSKYCKELFEPLGSGRVEVVPLAINPFYRNGVDARPERAKSDTFRFLMHGTLTARKAPVETLESFKKAFPIDKYPDVRILFKSRLQVLGLGAYQFPVIGDPRVEIITDGDWLPTRLLEAFNDTDVYVFPSRGEGYGLTPREAMLAGVPCIVSDNSALSEIANTRYNWPIRTKAKVGTIMGGEWSEPDWDMLVDTMRWHYHNREVAHDRALLASNWMLREVTGEGIARKWRKVFEGIDPSGVVRNEVLKVKRYENAGDHQQALSLVSKGALVLEIGNCPIVAQHARVKVRVAEPEDLNGTAGIKEHLVNFVKRPVEKHFTEIVSFDYLHKFYAPEISVIINGLTRAYELPIIISVPSAGVETTAVGENLSSLDYWMFLLKEFEITNKFYYGPNKEFIALRLTGFDKGFRGVVVRNAGGKMIQGVFHPTDPSRGAR